MASTGWTRFKDLSGIITSAVIHKQHDAFFNLEKALIKHKLDFLNMLKNPPRNSSHRSQVQSAANQGLKVSTVSHSLTLPQDFIDESLILSDILDLNEISAVELLLAGEQQLPNFPSLTRGLVAVLLYYDSKRCLVTSLRSLIQAREGLSWTLGLASNVSDMISKFTDELLHDGFVDEILKQVNTIDTEKELENLSKGQAIKDSQHRQQIIDLIDDTKHAMMDCLFYWSCQTPFDKDNILKLIKELKKQSVTNEGHKPMDYVSLAIFFTLIQSFSVSGSLHDLDSMFGEEHLMPVLSDNSLIPTLHKLVCKDDWSNPSIGAAVQFAWGIFLRECCPFDALNELEELQEDEEVIDHAIDNEAFQFIRQAVITSAYFFHEEYYVRRLHHVLTSFIVLMPNKITELRNHGDEAARDELLRAATRGPVPPQQLRQDFGEFMKLVGDLYYQDPNGLNLSLEYWAPVASNTQTGMALQVPHRQLSLLKFIHQCSDLLPPPLFTSFMSLLVGLSNSKEAALHCFNFLKSNSTSLGGGGPSASFSLDHFFYSLKQYYIGLKQDSRMKQTPTGCAISPQEVDGLLMVLKLVKTMAQFDENARVVMYENQIWLPVASMFGLIGCPVPRALKSEIFLTLAEFARSPEIAGTMWQTLENSQVLNTAPNISAGSGGHYGLGPSSQEGSIQIELEEIESKEEDYPQTRAFLSLLDSLTDVIVPSSLGIGHRVPGFQPYLEFVRDSVLLKFDTRAYKDPQEKWLVAISAMEIILKLLSHHEISPHDFEEQMYEVSPGRMVPLPLQPGHVILHHLLNDSTLLRKILFIIDDCCCLLMDIESVTDVITNAGLLALKILECAMSKQNAFFSVLRETSGHSVMATPLDHLLLGINPRTRNGDYYVTIARYVTIANCSPELALTAVRLLCYTCHTPAVSKEILSALTAKQDTCVSVLHGFIEHLEWEDPTPPMIASDTEPESENNPTVIRRQVKEEIVKLLIVCVQSRTPNIGRLLLGYIQPPFNKKKMNEISLQDPGILGSLKTCLHSVLQLVTIGTDPNNPLGCHMTHPRLAEECYHLLYTICHNHDLSEITMRFLRNNHNFFHVQLTHVPFPWQRYLENPNTLTSLKQQAWILCLAALEMRMTILKNQRSHAQQIVSLLLKSTTLTDQFNETSSSNNIPIWSTAIDIDYDTTHDMTTMLQEGRRKLPTILDCISFETVSLPTLQLQIFDQDRTESVISSCETSTQDDNGFLYTDIRTLHSLLMAELNSVQGAAVLSQKSFILEEIDEILKIAVNRNQIREVMHCNQQLMDSWCKVVEIMVGVVNEDQEKEGMKISVFFEIIQDLLLKVDNIDANSLTASAHGVIFTLMAHLRQTLSNQTDESDKTQSLGPLASGPLQSIFRSLLNNLVRCPVGMQRLRARLYSSLLSYLHMTKEKQEKKSGLWRLEQNTGLTGANLSVLSECGEGLMDVVCRDACNGHDVAKMLSLSLLDSIVDLDKHCHWLQYMTTKGYLQKLCSSFLWDDETLQNMLHPQPDALRPLYIYESKMAFLGRVASTPIGARELVSINCLASFTECKYIDCRPGNHGNQNTQSRFIPSINVRYLQLLLPVLRLLLALLTTPGPHTKDATDQVLKFICSHMDVFMSILKDTHSFISMGNLQELSLVTAIISQCKAGQDWMVDSTRPVTQELILIQSVVLSLLPNFLTPLHWKKISQEVCKNEDGGRGSNSGPLWEETYGLSQHICSNLMTYCQNALTATGSEFSVNFYRILFTPDLSLALSQMPQGQMFKTSSGPPSIGLLIASLREVCDGYFVAVETIGQMQKKMDGIRNMTSDELKQLIPEVTERNTLTLSQLQNLSRATLQRFLDGKKQQMSMFIYILEHMLCILWRHLQFFLIHCKPTQLDDSLAAEEMLVMRTAMRKLHQSSDNCVPLSYRGGPKERFDVTHLSNGITTNDLEQLKLNITKCLTDSLFKKLLDINDILSQEKDDSTVGFIHALTRRIKKLLKLKAAAKPLLHL